MENITFLHPNVEHNEKRKWDPFLQNEEPMDTGFNSLTNNQSFTMEAAVAERDAAALEGVRGELAGFMMDESTEGHEAGPETIGTEGQDGGTEGHEAGTGGIEGESGSDGSDGGENE